MDKHLLEQIKSKFTIYTNAEKRVADVVLGNPESVVGMSIGKLALEAGVSDPTIMRFARSLGFEGFKDFKIKLAQELASNNHYVHREVKAGDDAKTYIKRVGQYTIGSLSELINQLDENNIQKIVNSLSVAKKIEFWGFGASAAVAHDAYHKFFRLGIPCISSSDSHMQAMGASVMDEYSVVVAISHTGRSKDLIENVKFAKDSGATIIAITSKNSPLENIATYSVGLELDEDTNVFTPMVSRLAHLLIMDILIVGISLYRGEDVINHFKTIKDALLEKKLKGDG